MQTFCPLIKAKCQGNICEFYEYDSARCVFWGLLGELRKINKPFPGE